MSGLANPLRILLVEDCPNDTLFFRHALKMSRLNAQVYVVNDGERAIQYLQGIPPYSDRGLAPFPDIVVTDLKMPRVDGFALLEWMKSRPEFAIIPTTIMSGSPLPGDVEKAYALGANAYICKPSSLDDLANILRTIHAFWSLCEKPMSPRAVAKRA